MGLNVLFGIIVLQVATFQFAAVRLARRLPDYLVGYHDLPADLADRVQRFRESAGRVRYAVGVLLLAGAVSAMWVLPLSTGTVKLVLAAISVISSLAFLIAYLHDRRRLSALAATLPEPALRSASLRGPAFRPLYNPSWEMVPLLIFLATTAASLWATFGGAGDGADHRFALLVLPLAQGSFVLTALAYTVWSVRSGSRLEQRAKAHMGTPEQAIRIEESLERLNLRCFVAAKILVTLLLATLQGENILAHLGRGVPKALGLSSWALVLLLMLLYLTFLAQASRVRRSARP